MAKTTARGVARAAGVLVVTGLMVAGVGCGDSTAAEESARVEPVPVTEGNQSAGEDAKVAKAMKRLPTADVTLAGYYPPPPPPECPPPEPPEEEDRRRMTGGGSVFTTTGMRVTHGFQLRCDETDPRQNLQVNWGPGNRFHLTELTFAECLDTPLDERPPTAGFDTFVGEGTGRFNGVAGARIVFTFTDAGEPGVLDVAEMEVFDAGGNLVMTVSNTLDRGNHQAHRR